MKKIVFVISFIFALIGAQSQIIAPHIQNITTKEYGNLKSPEVWSITQDENGLMYFGFANEIGIYDGVNWEFVSIPKSYYITSLHYSNGRVYFGGYSRFGYLEQNSKGHLEAVFISEKTQKQFANIWRIHSKDDLIVFQSYEALFTLKNDSLSTIIPKTSYHLSFKSGNKIVVRERNIGLMEVFEDHTQLLNDNLLLQEYGIFETLDIGGDKILLVTHELGFWQTNKDLSAPLIDPCGLDCQYAIDVGIIGGVKIKENLFALNSTTNGVYFIDNNGRKLGHVNFKSGLTSDEVKDAFVDKNGKLWLATGNGISKIEVLEPFEFIGEEFGINGNVQCIKTFKGFKYIGTSLGLRREMGSSSLKFEKTEIRSQVWDIASVDDFLFVATNSGVVKTSDGNNFETVLQGDFNALYFDEINRFLICAGKNGVFILDEFSDWNLFSSYDFSKHEINKIAYDSKNDCYWIGSFSGGILKVIFDGFDFNFRTYGRNEGEGLRIGEAIIPFEIDGTCLFGTPYDFLEYTNEQEAIEELKISGNWHDSLVDYPEFYPGSFYESQKYFLGSSRNYQYFLQSGDLVLAAIENKIGYFTDSSVFDISKFKTLELGRVNFMQLEEDGLYIGGSNGLSKINLLQLLNEERVYNYVNINIRKVTYNDSIHIYGYQLKENLSFPFDRNKISFEYASNTIHNDVLPEYSWRLVGDDDNWSPWTNRVKVDFKNLYEGDYIFEVKAKDAFGNESEVRQYHFSITEPWYRTVWAYIGYVVFFLIIVYLAIILGQKRLKAQNVRLEGIVEERTAEIREKNAELEHSYHEIAEQKQEITDSINYAQRIQHAILPLPEVIKQHLDDYFVIFQPKDIVSGDFYWFAQTEKGVVFVCADCTGHGVPGAFMSMIGSDKLNQAVLEAKLTNPSDILSFLNRGIKKSLKQKEDEEGSSRDGMDVIITHIDTKNMHLQMSAAHNSLLMIRDGELHEFKATKVAVGGFTPENQVYHLEEIDMKPGDVYYMTTDGYPDQFGGDKGKKLKIAVLKRILLDIHQKPMNEQKTFLKNYMREWMGPHEQIDDICLIGFRV